MRYWCLGIFSIGAYLVAFVGSVVIARIKSIPIGPVSSAIYFLGPVFVGLFMGLALWKTISVFGAKRMGTGAALLTAPLAAFFTFVGLMTFMDNATYSNEPIPRALWILTAVEIRMVIIGVILIAGSILGFVVARRSVRPT